ncbi:tRNA epoxyqueuosine(34) reductase QueG [Clostridium hydrogeniformans]|uniref:tRNA epoxyqueuosine(34) reductase QueG n=1 Tax=Clostridium hydrogeniformans TaxID=349933 RepID=UPI00048208F5|nr:tRNA epoxyqueuosine(34) reductase QueG [Clostridium hydrogeniformans]
MKDKIVNFCNGIGIDTIGFTKCRVFHELHDFYIYRKENSLENEFEEKDIEKRINPFIYMEDGKTIISVAFPYVHNFNNHKDVYFSKYTQGKDYHRVVKDYLGQICEFIESIGGKAVPLVDSNALPERYIAALSGVGFIGKNNMVITKKYGSYVFLGEIITNLDLEASSNENLVNEIKNFTQCGECELCYKECPTKSINKVKKNSNICMSYITQKKDLEKKWIKLMNGRLFGCDTCQSCCPYNNHIELSPIKDFQVIDFMENVDLEEMIYMEKKTFKEKYLNTSCGWRGKPVLQRNALIAFMVKMENGEISEKDIKSPYVREYYNIIKNIV